MPILPSPQKPQATRVHSHGAIDADSQSTMTVPVNTGGYPGQHMMVTRLGTCQQENLSQNHCVAMGQGTSPHTGDLSVHRLRESLLSALTDQQKAVLIALPMEKRRAIIKTYMERQMRLAHQSRLQCDASNLNTACPQCIVPQENSPDKLGPSTIENIMNPNGVGKNGLVFTDVGHGQYICSGIPQMMAFGCPSAGLPVKVEWPRNAGKPPVRTLHRSIDNARNMGVSPEKVSYVVPVGSQGQYHRSEGFIENDHRNSMPGSGSISACRSMQGQASTGTSPIPTSLLLNEAAVGSAETDTPASICSPEKNHNSEPPQPNFTAPYGSGSQANTCHIAQSTAVQSHGLHSPAQHNSHMNLIQNARRCNSSGINHCSLRKASHHCCSGSGTRAHIHHALGRNGYVSNGHVSASGSEIRLVKAAKSAKQWERSGGENGMTTRARKQRIQSLDRYFPRNRVVSLRSSINNTPNTSSSGSSNITQMDSNTKKLLAALDSGELASSLLENPFC